jgi:predicted hydrocarbon binding protein
MQKIALSGLYYPNKIARIFIQGIAEVLGEAEYADVLKRAGLEKYLADLPPDNFERKFDFAEFSTLNSAVDMVDGIDEKTIRAIGSTTYKQGLKSFGPLLALGGISIGFRALPSDLRLMMGLRVMATTFSTFSDQVTEVRDNDPYFEYIIRKCPICWGRTSDHACCAMGIGLIEQGLRWINDNREFEIVETECRALGHEACIYRISKTPLSPSRLVL